MSDTTIVEHQVENVVQEAEASLRSTDGSPFSASAFTTLQDRIREHIVNLVTESLKVAKRHQADTVSSNHVERASEYLVSSSSRRFLRHLGTLGGILLGASLSTLLSMAGSASYTAPGVILSAILGIVGSFLIALHMAKE